MIPFSRETVLILFLTLFIAVGVVALPTAHQWTLQQSGVTARLRGLSAVNDRVVWASGAGSTVLRTVDGGATWQKLTVTTDDLDFRDIDAVDEQTAYVLSIGNGATSRIYKTTDAGATWIEQFRNTESKGFLDAMSFWDATHGIAMGDSIDRQFYILTTSDGGKSWLRVPANVLPKALDNEGAFAASGTNIALYGKSDAWIATGGGAKSRILRTSDRGRTWKVSETPIVAGASAGVFSIAFRDANHGVIVGGDYKKEDTGADNLALTEDGGITWQLHKGLSGYRSGVAYVPGGWGDKPSLIAVGPTGSDYSGDDGLSWRLNGPGFDTVSFDPLPKNARRIGWAAGKDGNLGRLIIDQ
ncbi:MAG: oxidoreductase [bacterium]